MNAVLVAARGYTLKWLQLLLAVVLSNVPTLLFVSGLVLVHVGVSAFSKPAANILLGVILMTVAAWPYIAVRKA